MKSNYEKRKAVSSNTAPAIEIATITAIIATTAIANAPPAATHSLGEVISADPGGVMLA